MKNVRGIETWNSYHDHSSPAVSVGTTVQLRSAEPHPDTRLPGYRQEMDFVSGAYWAEFDPSVGMAVTVNRCPAATTPEPLASRNPHRG
jgi:hypothetical protein